MIVLAIVRGGGGGARGASRSRGRCGASRSRRRGLSLIGTRTYCIAAWGDTSAVYIPPEPARAAYLGKAAWSMCTAAAAAAAA